MEGAHVAVILVQAKPGTGGPQELAYGPWQRVRQLISPARWQWRQGALS